MVIITYTYPIVLYRDAVLSTALSPSTRYSNLVICLHLFVGQPESCHAHGSSVPFFKALSEPPQEVLGILWCKSQVGKGCIRVFVQNFRMKPLGHAVRKVAI